MGSVLTLVLIVAFGMALGLPLLVWLDRPAAGTPLPLTLPRLFGALALGLGIIGWLALLLAEAGLFQPVTLGLTGLMLLLPLLWLVLRRRHRLVWPSLPWPHFGVILLWLIVAGVLFFRPHQFIHGGADAGVYVNIAAQLVERGSLLSEEPLLASLPTGLVDVFLRPLEPADFGRTYLFPGFYVPEPATSVIEPQFYHLHPAWQAIALMGGGIAAALAMTGLWALLGASAITLTARQLGGDRVAWLVLAALTVNALQIWFARYPTTETLAQFLLWTGLWSVGRWLSARRPAPFWPLLAGVMLGSAFLVRIDLLFLFAFAPFIFLWRQSNGRSPRTDLWFYIPFALLAAHALAHALLITPSYFNNTFGLGVALALRFWPLPVTAIALFLGATAILSRRRREAGSNRLAPVVIHLATLVLLLLAAYGAFVRPNLATVAARTNWYDGRSIPRVDAQNVPRLNGYLSPLGYGLAVAGSALLLARLNRRNAAVVGVGCFFALLYLWRIQANPQQIYSMRRYVPAVMPFMLVAAAVTLDWLGTQRHRAAPFVAAGLAVVWLGSLGWLARGFVTQVDYAGLPAQVAAVAAAVPPDAILLFNDTAPVGQGDFLGTPMRFIHGRSVFVLRAPVADLATALADTLTLWQGTGRDIYWIAVPGGQPWPLPDWTLTPLTDYTIATSVLEAPEARRPTAVLPVEWTGTIYHLSPP